MYLHTLHYFDYKIADSQSSQRVFVCGHHAVLQQEGYGHGALITLCAAKSLNAC